MTVRQKFLKTVYPVYVRLQKVSEKKTRVLTNDSIAAILPFHKLVGELGNGQPLDFSTFKGKKVLLVNTASGCGFTEQFDQLQRLYKQYSHELVVLAFPTNDFDTDNNNDEQIALFCKENYRVSFPIMKKSVVKSGKRQNVVFSWLSNAYKNGWSNQAPTWNFCKYLVDENGMLVGYFGSAIEPTAKEILQAIVKTP